MSNYRAPLGTEEPPGTTQIRRELAGNDLHQVMDIREGDLPQDKILSFVVPSIPAVR